MRDWKDPCKFRYFWTSYTHVLKTEEENKMKNPWPIRVELHFSFLVYGDGWYERLPRVVAMYCSHKMQNLRLQSMDWNKDILTPVYDDPYVRMFVPMMHIGQNALRRELDVQYTKFGKEMFPFLWEYADLYFTNSFKRESKKGNMNGRTYPDYDINDLYDSNNQYGLDSIRQFYTCAGEDTKTKWLWLQNV